MADGSGELCNIAAAFVTVIRSDESSHYESWYDDCVATAVFSRDLADSSRHIDRESGRCEGSYWLDGRVGLNQVNDLENERKFYLRLSLRRIPASNGCKYSAV